jgi:hypothetical protein
LRACYHSVQNLLSSRQPSRRAKIRICKTTILPVVLYGCCNGANSLLRNLDESHCLGNKIIEEWRKLHNGELRDLYSSPSIIRMIKSGRMKRTGHVARIGEERKAYRCW